MFLVLLTLGSLGYRLAPKLPVGNFVEQGSVHRSLSANKKAPQGGFFIGGQRGIRTLERLSPLHTFQACAFNHSATCPAREKGGYTPRSPPARADFLGLIWDV